jgi:hypothetical protein
VPEAATIRVTPALLQSRAARFVAEAITVRETSARVHADLTTTGEEAAGLQVSGALTTCARRFSDNLMLCSLGVAGTGEKLARAGADYTATEASNAASLTAPEGGAAP